MSYMGYKVRYLVHERETGHELVSDFESAKTLAENYASADPANTAEVIDSEGAVRLRRPRTARPA